MKMTLPIAVASLLIALVVTMQIPIEIYINNADEFSLSLRSLIYTWGIGFAVVFLGYFAPILIPSNGFRERYFSFLGTWALLMWCNAHFMFGHYGSFDGNDLLIDPFSRRAIIEAILWLSAIALAIIFSKKINKYLFQATAGLLVVVFIITAYQFINYARYENKNVYSDLSGYENMPKDFLTFSTRGNIIHIVLDAQDSTLIEHLLSTDSRFSQNFAGFTFFPNTAANYFATLMAIPAMLTGKVYKNEEDINIFLQRELGQNPFIAALENADYHTSIYSMAYYCNTTKLKNCIPQPELPKYSSAVLLLEYSLFKVSPDLFKQKIARNGRWGRIGKIINHFFNFDHKTSLNWLHHLDFEYFNDNLIIRDTAPTYKFYHTMITHPPRILKENCELSLTDIRDTTISGRVEQSTCAFSHVFTFYEKLKQAGIYDNTLIIISSDHGSNYISSMQQENSMYSSIDAIHHSRSLATLLIKPFGSVGPLQVSDVPVSLSDIPNTIMGLTGLPLLPYGENVFTLMNTQPRVREYIFYEYSKNFAKENALPPFTLYSIDGDVRDIRNWQVKCTDVLMDTGVPPC